jgi:hypothetical protein
MGNGSIINDSQSKAESARSRHDGGLQMILIVCRSGEQAMRNPARSLMAMIMVFRRRG